MNDAPSASRDAGGVAATARQILEAAYYSFLTTIDRTGRAPSRLLQHFDPDEDLTVRLGTSANSRKVAQIEGNPDVLLTCQGAGERSYVTLNGAATVHRDAATKRKYWKEPWRAIWPSGPEGEDYLVIEVRPERIEVVDLVPGSTFSTSRPVIIERDGAGWRLVDSA